MLPYEEEQCIRLYLADTLKYPRLTAEEEVKLAYLVQCGTQEEKEEALTKLVNCNLRLVIPFARSIYGFGLSFMDKIQEGNAGLMQAASRYDGRNRFSTYACWWIRQAITRAVCNTGHHIRLPAGKVDTLKVILAVKVELEQTLGRVVTVKELSEKTGVKIDLVEMLLVIGQQPLSLDYDNDDEDRSIANQLCCHDDDSVLISEDVVKALKFLSKDERKILILRYNLDAKGERTLEQVGMIIGRTRERVRQIESRALAKIKARFPELKQLTE